MSENKIVVLFAIAIVLLLGIFGVGGNFVSAYMEAKTWNKICPEKPITTWDALWADFRITP